MEHIFQGLLGLPLCHRLHHRRSLDAERACHVLCARCDAPEDTPCPHFGDHAESQATWMKQVCRNLTDCEDGFLKDASHLIVVRDTSFIAMRVFLEQNADTEVVLLPPKSPHLNAYMERWFRSLKAECLDRMIYFGHRSLENAVREYVVHYHGERNHQGLGNELITPQRRYSCRCRLHRMQRVAPWDAQVLPPTGGINDSEAAQNLARREEDTPVSQTDFFHRLWPSFLIDGRPKR